jgi:hydroxyacylglutathione hydrolase
MNLEDEFSDVLSKAMRGLGLSSSTLADASGIPLHEIEALLRGEMNEAAARAASRSLGLDAEALIALPSYLPQPIEIPGIRRIELPFGQWLVNAWELEREGIRILFDTGFGETDILRKISTVGLDAVLITHADRDHIGGMAALAAQGIRVITAEDALSAGTLIFGSLCFEVVDLSGHFSPAVGYLIHGLECPLMVSGDAIFAGSMGACHTIQTFELASQTLSAALGKTDPTCVILPGHGPATTFAEEIVSNPFHLRFEK